MAQLTDLQSGRMRVHYESGRLRYVRVDGIEILRQVYMAVRDRHWNTIPARIVDEQIQVTSDGFLIQLEVEHRQGDIDFRWRGTLRGSGNRIEAALDGEAHSSFLRNRIGWCVLHPTRETAGKRCAVRHPDGSIEGLEFPDRISPHQPFLDVKAMTWSPAPGLTATVEFEGDVFETEDQRNWTDDSFKTYSTPLRLPFPVQVNPGDRVKQRVVLRIEERPAIRLTDRFVPFPQLAESQATVHVRSRADLEQAKRAAAGRRIARWIVYDAGKPATTPETIALAREVLGNDVLIGGGAETNFTEVNRNRDFISSADFIAFAANPQVHASDELTIVENLPAIGAAVESARALAGAKPVILAPLTFKRMFNPHAPDVPEPPDPREQQRFATAWLVGAIKYAAEAGVSGITLKPNALVERIAAFRPERGQATESSHPMEAVALALVRGAERMVLIANLTATVREVEFEDRTLRIGPYEVTQA